MSKSEPKRQRDRLLGSTDVVLPSRAQMREAVTVEPFAMEAIMQRFAMGVMVAGFALSVGALEAADGCGAHNETVAQKNTVTQPQAAQQTPTVAQPQASQQALTTVPVATASSSRDSESATAQQ